MTPAASPSHFRFNTTDVDELTRIINGLHALAREAAEPAGRLNRHGLLSGAALALIAGIQERTEALGVELGREVRGGASR